MRVVVGFRGKGLAATRQRQLLCLSITSAVAGAGKGGKGDQVPIRRGRHWEVVGKSSSSSSS